MAHHASALPLERPSWPMLRRSQNSVHPPCYLHPAIEYLQIGRKQPASSVCAALRRPLHQPYRVRAPKAVALDEEALEAAEKASPVSAGAPKIGPTTARFVVPEFYTREGLRLAIVGSAPQLGAWEGEKALGMTHQGNHRWTADLAIEPGWRGAVEFKLVLIDERGPTFEDGSNRLFLVDGSEVGDMVIIECVWGSTTSTPHLPAPLSSSSEDEDDVTGLLSDCHVYVPYSPDCSPSCVDEMRLVGGAPQLGSWNPDQGAELTTSDSGVWRAHLKLPAQKLVEAKIIVRKAGQAWRWEKGPNRTLLLVADGESSSCSASPSGPAPHAMAAGKEDSTAAKTRSPTAAVQAQQGPGSRPSEHKHSNSCRQPERRGGKDGVLGNSCFNDFAMILHWGVTSYSQVVFRGAVDPRYCTAASPTATNTIVNFTVPCFPTLPGQHLVVVGDDPLLGSWDPAKGLPLGWEAGNRWTASVQLPLKPVEAKLVLVQGDRYTWEPSSSSALPIQNVSSASSDSSASAGGVAGSASDAENLMGPDAGRRAAAAEGGSNRRLDLGALVTAGSPTGAGDVHVACQWGETHVTPVIIIPKPPPALVVEAGLDEDQSARKKEHVVAGPTTVILQGSAADHAKDEVLINLLSFLVSGSILAPELSAMESAALKELAEAREKMDMLARELETQAASLSSELAKAQSDILAAADREGKLKRALNEALYDAGVAKKTMQELAGSQRLLLSTASQQHQASMAEACSSYEARILDIQRGYEARILELQDHESRILELQSKHSSKVSELEAKHKVQVQRLESTLARCTKDYSQKLDVLQSQLRAAAVALQEQARQHEIRDWELRTEMKEAEAAHAAALSKLEEHRQSELEVMQAKHRVREEQLQTQLERAIAEHKVQVASIEKAHAEERNQLQKLFHESAVAHKAEVEALRRQMEDVLVVERELWGVKVAALEAGASSASEDAARKESALRFEMKQAVSKLQRRGIFLAQALAKKQLDNDMLRQRLFLLEAKTRRGHLAALEKMMDNEHQPHNGLDVPVHAPEGEARASLDIDLGVDPPMSSGTGALHLPYTSRTVHVKQPNMDVKQPNVHVKQPMPLFVTTSLMHVSHTGNGSGSGGKGKGNGSPVVNGTPATTASAGAALGTHHDMAPELDDGSDSWAAGEGQDAAGAHNTPCVPVYGNNILSVGGSSAVGLNGMPASGSAGVDCVPIQDIGGMSLKEATGVDCEWLSAPVPGLLLGSDSHHFSLSAFMLAAWLAVLQQQIPTKSQM